VLGLGLCWRGEIESGLARIAEAVALADELGSGPEQFQVHLHLADALFCAGRFAESADAARRASAGSSGSVSSRPTATRCT